MADSRKIEESKKTAKNPRASIVDLLDDLPALAKELIGGAGQRARDVALLMAASDFEYYKKAFYLLTVYHANVHAKDTNGKSIVYFALRDYNQELFEFAQKHKVQFPLPDAQQNNVLHLVARGGAHGKLTDENAQQAQAFLTKIMAEEKAGAFLASNNEGDLPLHIMARVNNVNAVFVMLKLLAEKLTLPQMGKLFRAQNRDGDTAFHLAARHKRWDILKLMASECLTRGIRCDVNNTEQQAAPDSATNSEHLAKYGRTALFSLMEWAEAEADIDLDCVKLLIRCRMDEVFNVRMLASRKGFTEIMTLLEYPLPSEAPAKQEDVVLKVGESKKEMSALRANSTFRAAEPPRADQPTLACMLWPLVESVCCVM